MKKLLVILTAGLLFGPATCNAAQTAQARMFCLSLRFGQGTTYGYYLDLTTISYDFNGELAWYDESSQRSWYELHDAYYYFDMTGTIFVDRPAFADANGNRFNDFFEVSQAVSATTYGGSYTDDYGLGGGDVTAQWSRSAGSKNGTCVLNFYDETYGDLGDFTHSFELLEYTGPLSYTPGSNTVSGSVNLTQTGNSANHMYGPVQFVKVATNRFNMLTFDTDVTWTNASLQTLAFYPFEYVLEREAPWPTNYYGWVEFYDGDPSTTDDDYYDWELSIDDTNDTDHDGIPDFSDDPPSLPRRPVLQLTRGTTNLLLRISGDINHLHQILEVASLTSTNWTTNQSLTLTTDPQTVSLPIPSGPRFYRVRAQ